MTHPYHMHREHQVSHRRVAPLLKEEPAGAKQHMDGGAFSKVTSKTAAVNHDMSAEGGRGAKRYARGGRTDKNSADKGATNIAIVIPGGGNRTGAPPVPGPMPGPPPAPPPPMAGPGGPPPGGPPPMPMARATGGRANLADKAELAKWSKRASANSYFRGGAASGVGREEKAEQMKRKGR